MFSTCTFPLWHDSFTFFYSWWNVFTIYKGAENSIIKPTYPDPVIIDIWGMIFTCDLFSLLSVLSFSCVQLFAFHGLQHARPPCPSPVPRVHTNLCPSSWWCYPTTLSSVVPFSSCLPSFPASGSFQMSQLFASGGQCNGVSGSTSVLPMNTMDWSPLGWAGSPCSPRDSQESSPTPQLKTINSSAPSFLHSPTLTSIHDQWKNHSLD